MSYKSRSGFNIPMCLPNCQCITCKIKNNEKKKKTPKEGIPKKEKS